MKGYIKHKHEGIPKYFKLVRKGINLADFPLYICIKIGRNRFKTYVDGDIHHTHCNYKYYKSAYDIEPMTEAEFFLEML